MLSRHRISFSYTKKLEGLEPMRERRIIVYSRFQTSTAVKRPKRFSFYLVGYYLMLSGNMGKDV